MGEIVSYEWGGDLSFCVVYLHLLIIYKPQTIIFIVIYFPLIKAASVMCEVSLLEYKAWMDWQVGYNSVL